MCVSLDVRGKPSGICSFLLASGSWGLNSVCKFSSKCLYPLSCPTDLNLYNFFTNRIIFYRIPTNTSLCLILIKCICHIQLTLEVCPSLLLAIDVCDYFTVRPSHLSERALADELALHDLDRTEDTVCMLARWGIHLIDNIYMKLLHQRVSHQSHHSIHQVVSKFTSSGWLEARAADSEGVSCHLHSLELYLLVFSASNTSFALRTLISLQHFLLLPPCIVSPEYSVASPKSFQNSYWLELVVTGAYMKVVTWFLQNSAA